VLKQPEQVPLLSNWRTTAGILPLIEQDQEGLSGMQQGQSVRLFVLLTRLSTMSGITFSGLA
jgi:hypothetical protein